MLERRKIKDLMYCEGFRKHLHPIHVNTTMLLFMDYCDIVWFDGNNKVLVNSLQILQSIAVFNVLTHALQ